MTTPVLVMTPDAGERLQRFVGDRIRFVLASGDGQPLPKGWQARLRTNLGRGGLLCKEIIQAHAKNLPLAGASWHDLPMQNNGAEWNLELPLIDTGYFKAKPYFMDPDGWQHWPDGTDVSISVHPDWSRTGNTIYCAFTRMFGESRTAIKTIDEAREKKLQAMDAEGYTVIPPSGKFRDLITQLPHIIDTLGCRILHLLPVNPTPTTMARYGRFGSPYAALDLTAIDPALEVFDRRTTGVDQFMELTYAAHLRGARVFLDIVSNHTGWGSNLEENHPEWFVHSPDGTFVSPGAWGTIWEDLVELEHRHVELWDYLAEVFLTWCRRGVDGFRCDAGYKVPLAAWQYITGRVRQEFPDTVFLLEGLGGAWKVTEQLLVEGGMQWAYSELFQNYSGKEIADYLDYALRIDGHAGLLVNYSETHDNDRLAVRGRAWSLLRNRLCALTSVSGGFGFTSGVEWLAPERVNVHSSRGLAWGNPDNIVSELARLNRLLNGHPCFFDNATLARLSAPDSPIYALRRVSSEGRDSLLVLVNNDEKSPQKFLLSADAFPDAGKLAFDLAGSVKPKTRKVKGAIEFTLEPGAAHCLSLEPNPHGLTGENYRHARAQAAWALTALGHSLPVEEIPAIDWHDLARIVEENPVAMLAACSSADADTIRTRLEALRDGKAAVDYYARVVVWELLDRRRILPVPQSHWLLIRDTAPFRAMLSFGADLEPQHARSIAVREGHVAFFCPCQPAGNAQLTVERYAAAGSRVQAQVRFLAPEPMLGSLESGEIMPAANVLEQPLALLTDGIGGMARMCVDFGAIKSKYDCLLGASLHPKVPVDRHIFAKRARLWVNADGFITPLDMKNLVSFKPGPPAIWRFRANAGDGRMVEIRVTANMLEGRNTTALLFSRPIGDSTTGECDARLTVRVDIEDRNFHSETKRNSAADYHFSSHTQTLKDQPGFLFAPADDRHLRVFASGGVYHPEPEWSENIAHPVEQSRGQEASGDAYSPGWFELPLPRGAKVSLVMCADDANPSPETIQKSLGTAFSNKAVIAESTTDLFDQTLTKAVRSFVVRRDEGVTVIAGYPWFLDWGRDSLICARGLLAAGMTEQVKQLLVAFGRFEKEGTLPNTIHGEDASNRDTSDAPLWYGIVCEEAAALAGEKLYQTKVHSDGRTIADVLSDIALGYINGTPNTIHMDPDSALVWSPCHFTWMDTNYPSGTPREGYPVEIQVLWIRLLQQMERIDVVSHRKRWGDLAKQAMASLQKYFWLEKRGYFSDLLAAKTGQPAGEAVADDALRSNYLLAVSLGLVSGTQAQRCVEAALRYLVIPGALRTLAPLPVTPPLPIRGKDGQLLNNPAEPYWGRYEGDEDTRRKPAYHNGTAWTWTFPIFCEALARAWDFSPEAVAAARAYLGSMDRSIKENCVGQVPEIVDGDAPHTQRGCDAQAWGATEALRVWKILHKS